jgi:hypothetical protein
MAKRVAYEPMTLGNTRQHGMTRLDVSCHGPDCWHRAEVTSRGVRRSEADDSANRLPSGNAGNPAGVDNLEIVIWIAVAFSTILGEARLGGLRSDNAKVGRAARSRTWNLSGGLRSR